MNDDYVKRSDVHKAFQPKYAPAINRTFAAMIDNIPAADVVAVVRCHECKHSTMHKFPYNYEKVLACDNPHFVTLRAVKPMHFCSYGERNKVE